jgi:hypothetical protein
LSIKKRQQLNAQATIGARILLNPFKILSAPKYLHSRSESVFKIQSLSVSRNQWEKKLRSNRCVVYIRLRRLRAPCAKQRAVAPTAFKKLILLESTTQWETQFKIQNPKFKILFKSYQS